MERKIKLTIEYDGSRYHGWQFQKNAVSVQEVLSKAIKKLTGEDIIPDGGGKKLTRVFMPSDRWQFYYHIKGSSPENSPGPQHLSSGRCCNYIL